MAGDVSPVAMFKLMIPIPLHLTGLKLSHIVETGSLEWASEQQLSTRVWSCSAVSSWCERIHSPVFSVRKRTTLLLEYPCLPPFVDWGVTTKYNMGGGGSSANSEFGTKFKISITSQSLRVPWGLILPVYGKASKWKNVFKRALPTPARLVWSFILLSNST